MPKRKQVYFKKQYGRNTRMRVYAPKAAHYSSPRLRGPKTSVYNNIPQLQNLRYCQEFTLNPGAGSIANQQFRAGSIFDPDVTGAGHQPMRRDQLAVFYNHYVVVGAKITVYVVPEASTASQRNPIVLGVYLSDDTTIPSVYTTIIEQGRGSYKFSGTSVAAMSTMLTTTYSAKQFFNITNIKDNLDRIGAAIGTSPSEQAIFNVYAQAMDLSSDPDPVQCVAVIDYAVQFSEPKDTAEN